ncbi:prolyl oligopeptidase family serine peptidase [Aureibaculum sp. A20]|uniref:Prolyl oligopeptidase family serine peptidase n=1 Tax=Aureibaculum flavum TaxID=2795986 RepID=A0ABS0WUW7_9FLAO|nr:PHB depolymerase family esterase [Aureibaculum flavum]MBJ2175733.1 prolyl oligopeptidase family serine peptidase [Aureibaculum flavum]
MRNLKPNLLSIIIMVSLLMSSCTNTVKDSTFYHDNLERTYVLYKPINVPENAPLVFVLHSYGRYANEHMQSLQLNSLAETNKFVVCYPQGTLDVNTGKPYWTGGLSNSSIDDVGYLTELAKYLQTKYNLDSNRTFVCGISNGGFMSYALACESPDVFKAMASVTGTMTGHLWKNRNAIKLPIPILQISGMKDDVVPIDGSMSIEYGWGGAPHMDSIMNYWSRFNQCKETDTLFISKVINAYHYKNGIHGNEVWYYKLNNFGHDLPTLDNSGLASNELIWDFFSKY